MLNIFFVNSPFQLLCSIEAVYQFNTINNVLVIFNKGKGETLNQIQILLKKYGSKFDDVKYIDSELESISGWVSRLDSMNCLIDEYSEVERLFIGDYRSGLVRHFSNSIKYKEIILLDDGFSTIHINRLLNKGKLHNWRDYIKYILSRGKYRFKAKKKVSYFTIFEQYLDTQNIYVNNFNNFIHSNQWIEKDEAFWLGSAIVEDKIVSEEYYFKRIQDCLCKNGINKEIIYFPHRREDDKKLKDLENKFGFQIKTPKLPIELYVINKSIKPSIIISFYSTALYSLNRILSTSNVYYISIDKDKLLKQAQEVQEVYGILDREINDISTLNYEKA